MEAGMARPKTWTMSRAMIPGTGLDRPIWSDYEVMVLNNRNRTSHHWWMDFCVLIVFV